MFAIFTICGSSAAVTHTLCGRRLRSMRRVAILRGAHQALAEVVVHRGIGAAACGPGQGERARAHPLTADQQLRTGGEERAVTAPSAEDVARRERLAQDPEDGGRIVIRRRQDLDLAGQDDLLELTRADALDAARDGALVVLGRHRPGHAWSRGGLGIQQR